MLKLFQYFACHWNGSCFLKVHYGLRLHKRQVREFGFPLWMKFRTKQKCHANATFVTDNKIKQLSTLSMNVHRTYKPCREMAHCQYQNGCYFSHTPVPLAKVRCYQSGEEFSSKNVMIAHRKIHWVAECRNFINNQCKVNEIFLVATCNCTP